MGRLAGKVAIVTGAAQGMGAAHARLFVEQGARVVLTDLNADAGGALAAELGAAARFVTHDVASAADWQAVVAAAEAAFGPVTVLVNNAGIIGPVIGTIEITEAQYAHVCAINQTGVFLGMQTVLARHGGGGRWIDRQHLVDLGDGGERRHAQPRLCRQQVRGARHDQACRGRVRRSQHPG